MRKTVFFCALLLMTSLSAEAVTIIDKPIDFGPKRVEMTKAYIAQHYGKKVKDITIVPKIIVLALDGRDEFRQVFQPTQTRKALE